ncbi:MAG: Crp/Fnr family transcriptional regulator [Spirochaetaceae bacterium]|jgi:CRP-like cAMP-binding protein|nr:Crp/Fnr family transcriptional regulator [Spirochaetaceae bacterium]
MAQPQLEFLNFKKDSFIIIEGEKKADRFYIIRQGNVRIAKEVDVVEGEKDLLVTGDFFAVVSTMSAHNHIETAQAASDVSLISVKKEQYGDIIKNNPNIALKIIQQFSKQTRLLNEALTKLTMKNTASEDASHLFDVAEYYCAQKQYNQAYYAYKKYLEYCPDGENAKTAMAQKSSIALNVFEDNFKYRAEGAVRTYPASSVFFSESEPGEELFIIQKGAVKIAKIIDGNEIILAILKAGDIFGEMALLENKPRSASALAHDGECVVTAVDRANFEVMAKSQPQIISRLTTVLAERIWSMYRQLSSALITDPLGRLYDALLLDLEKNRVDIERQEHTFSFGRDDLIKMAGLSAEEGRDVTRTMLENGKKMQVREEKLYCPDIRLIPKEVQYYRRMDKKNAKIAQSHQSQIPPRKSGEP